MQVVERTVEIPQLQIVGRIVEVPEIQMVQGAQTSESLGIAPFHRQKLWKRLFLQNTCHPCSSQHPAWEILQLLLSQCNSLLFWSTWRQRPRSHARTRRQHQRSPVRRQRQQWPMRRPRVHKELRPWHVQLPLRWLLFKRRLSSHLKKRPSNHRKRSCMSSSRLCTRPTEASPWSMHSLLHH